MRGLFACWTLLQRVPEEGGASSVLQAGGTVASPGTFRGRDRIQEMDKLKAFMEMAPRVSENGEWRSVVEAYYGMLSH